MAVVAHDAPSPHPKWHEFADSEVKGRFAARKKERKIPWGVFSVSDKGYVLAWTQSAVDIANMALGGGQISTT